ncbi:MAG: ABC transporter ATP-binding protein [Lachnospirales bacterium]
MIEVRNLNYNIGRLDILSNINLKIDKNDIVVIVGENGSGKTTLLKSIASLIKYQGDIFINNNHMKKLKHIDRAKIVSYLPQNCVRTNIMVSTLVKHSRFPYLKFGEELKKSDFEAIENAISITKIENILHKKVTEISGGERQLAYLTMVIAQNSDVVLLDEPNTFLDISHQLFLLRVIKEMKEQGKTVIIVLHDIIQAIEIADKIVVVHNGEIADYGRPNEVIGSVENIFNVKIAETLKIDYDENVPLYKYTLIN